MRRSFVALLFLTLLVLQITAQQSNTEWRYYSGDNRATTYSALDQINKDNVARLKVVWRHRQSDPAILATNRDLRLSNRYMATPIMVGGVLYVTNGLGFAEAIDPATGSTLWMQKPLVAGLEGLTPGTITKGVACGPTTSAQGNCAGHFTSFLEKAKRARKPGKTAHGVTPARPMFGR